MQERLLLEPEPEPEQVVPEVEVRLPQNAQAMVRSDGEQQEEGSGGAGGAAGEGGEPEGPKLSRDEEIHQTATRMYWLGYAFLPLMWIVCFVYCNNKDRVQPEVVKLGKRALINFAVAITLLISWYIYFVLQWEELGSFGEWLIVINPNTFWFEQI